MRDAARIQAAISCLDEALSGTPLERVLTAWGRANRYAGSKDRAAIRDLVYQAWRCQRSYTWYGGGAEQSTGRALMIGLLRARGDDPAQFFNGEQYAAAPLTGAELDLTSPMPEAVALDLPDWQVPLWQQRFGDEWQDQAQRLRSRAPVHLRVNLAKITMADAIEMLKHENIISQPIPNVATALHVVSGERKINRSAAYLQGFIELQDAASQSLALHIPLNDGQKVLDYCAGGGGKSLALRARAEQIDVFAHDANPNRMGELASRARRAGIRIPQLPSEMLQPHSFDVVLCDAPCSGSGSWRRDPTGKWDLSPEKLTALQDTQTKILLNAAKLVRPGGLLVHATCSVFEDENEHVTRVFLAQTDLFRVTSQKLWALGDPSDGFAATIMQRSSNKAQFTAYLCN